MVLFQENIAGAFSDFLLNSTANPTEFGSDWLSY
jgi:hypothetical protein